MTTQTASSADTDSGPAVNAVTVVLLILACICVSLRTYIRSKVLRSFGWDDVFMLISTAQAILAAAFIILSTKNGLGRHASHIGRPAVAKVVKWNTAYQIDNVLGVNTVKISILIMILRLQNHRSLRSLVWVVLVTMTVVNLATALFLACQCFPLKKLWEPSLPGSCAPHNAVFIIGYIQSGFSAATDLFCTVSPVFVLWKTQIKTNKKIAVCALMSLGLAATICNAMRNLYYKNLQMVDYTHDVVPILVVTMLEFYLGIIAANLPVITPVNYYVKWQSRKSYRRGQSTNISGGPQTHSGRRPREYELLRDNGKEDVPLVHLGSVTGNAPANPLLEPTENLGTAQERQS